MTIAAILGNKGTEVLTLTVDATVMQAVDLMAERRIGALPVLQDGKVAGVMSERDVIYCLRRDGAQILDWPLSRVMTSPAITVTREESVLGALSQITRRRIRHLPVVENDELIGIVSIGDLVKYRMDKIQEEADAMRSYIANA